MTQDEPIVKYYKRVQLDMLQMDTRVVCHQQFVGQFLIFPKETLCFKFFCPIRNNKSVSTLDILRL